MSDGADFEDNKPRPINHFFNPLTGNGLPIPLTYSAPVWALSDDRIVLAQGYTFRDARQAYYDSLTKPTAAQRDVASGTMFETLGHVLHLIQDMAQPQHVRNDIHYDKWQSTYSRYEKITDDVAASLPFNGYPNVYVKNDSRSVASARSFWQTGSNGASGVQIGKGLAEFTNRNFVSAGTNFGGTIDHLMPYSGGNGLFPFPDPALAQVGAPVAANSLDSSLPPGYFMLFISTPISETLFSEYQGKVNARTSTFSLFDQDLKLKGANFVFAVNRFNFLAAHQFLIPRAVAYSAGMVDYFFRGDIDIAPDEMHTGKYVIKNFNSEPMRGTFALYYDALDGTRKPVSGANWNDVSVPGFDTASGKAGNSAPIQIIAPADAKQAGKYMLVFRGDMGQETQDDGSGGNYSYGAVAGRLVMAVPLEALYVAGVDQSGRTISLRVDESGTHLLNGPDVNGVVRQSTEFDPVRPLVPVNVVNKRPYFFKQPHFLDQGGTQYRILSFSTAGAAFTRDFATQQFVASSGNSWTAQSVDPTVGSFVFYPLVGGANSGWLVFTRSFVDAQGGQHSQSGRILLPSLPNYDSSVPSINYQAFTFNSKLLISEDGLHVYGFRTGTKSLSPPGPWGTDTPFPRIVTTTYLSIALEIGLAATPTLSAKVGATTVQVERSEYTYTRTYSNQAMGCGNYVIPFNGTDMALHSGYSFTGEDTQWVGLFGGSIATFKIQTNNVANSDEKQNIDYLLSGNSCNWDVALTNADRSQEDDAYVTTYQLSDGPVLSTFTNSRASYGRYEPVPVRWHYECDPTALATPPCKITGDNAVQTSDDTGYQTSYLQKNIVVALTAKSDGIVLRDAILPPGALYLPTRFRGYDITGKDFVGDSSPLGEIFFATTDMSLIVHEPRAGRMPSFVPPSNMVRILAALWL